MELSRTLAFIYYILARGCLVAATSTLLTFTDDACRTYAETLIGKDSFPSGGCTNFLQQATSSFGSFMINTVDPGCGVTIYGSDTDSRPCSATLKIVADSTQCYNASWQYYSVDNCTPLTPTSSIGGPSTSTPTAVSTTASSTPEVNIGAIIGGSAAVAISITVVSAVSIIYFWLRPRWKGQNAGNGSEKDVTAPPTGTFANPDGHLFSVVPWQYGRPCEMSEVHVAEAPFHSERPYEMSPQDIVEAPGETHRR
ncbi:hypothetical protein F4810DRAFT_696849 [Camillea tinctor]|nr:hypothetical protein F4810DRAFT_696849 [Camillea tinctor]